MKSMAIVSPKTKLSSSTIYLTFQVLKDYMSRTIPALYTRYLTRSPARLDEKLKHTFNDYEDNYPSNKKILPRPPRTIKYHDLIIPTLFY
jgi:hypothetical protein